MNERVIRGLAFENAISSWNNIIIGLEQRIAGQREMQNSTGVDLSISIRLLESEIAIWRTAVEQAEERRKQLGGS